jgi:succinate dehydrogenase / fumarate reductase cytochrome b subunit
MAKTAPLTHSYVGKKALMAASGLVLLGFVVVHMLANLQMFAGAARIDGYARSLREVPLLLWSARALLVLAFLLHVVLAAQLAAAKRAARPVPYRRRWDLGAGTPARSMLWTGVVLAAFVLVHLANLTWGVWHPRFVVGDVYGNVVRLFRRAPAVVFYTLAMLALGLHVAHGSFSLWQSLGLNGPATSRGLRRGARLLAVAVASSLLSIVCAAALGWFAEAP